MLRSILVALVAMTPWLPSSSGAQSIKGVERIIYGPTFSDIFRRPMGLAIDAERGILAIGDTGNHRLALFDDMGRSRGVLYWGAEGGVVASGEPKCVALDKRGRLFVLDGSTGIIEVISSTGSRLGYVEPVIPEAAVGLTRPQYIALAPSGRCYVLFTGEVQGITVVEPTGKTSRTIGFEPAGRGLFETPIALAVDSAETRLVVLDPQAAHQVKVCDADGNLLHSFGKHGEGEGTFGLALFATWGPDDTLWIIDTMRHSISVYDADGTYKSRICGFGREPGQVSYPTACGFLSAERFVVLERVGSRFQILELEIPISEVSDDLEIGLGLSGSGGSGADEMD